MKARKTVGSERVHDEIFPDQNLELLKALHLLTRDGKMNADARRKIKQVNHLVNLIRPALDDLFERHSNPIIIDVGSGKSYLAFFLYDLFVRHQGRGELVSIESRPGLSERAETLARSMAVGSMKFLKAAIVEAKLPERVHLLCGLHACDTATDDAIIAGIKAQADYIALVPCCQAEVARQLADLKMTGSVSELWHSGIHRREFASLLTNVIRKLVLESAGYQVSVTELVGWEHSLKNEFIIAKRINRENKAAASRLRRVLSTVPVSPKCLRALP